MGMGTPFTLSLLPHLSSTPSLPLPLLPLPGLFPCPRPLPPPPFQHFCLSEAQEKEHCQGWLRDPAHPPHLSQVSLPLARKGWQVSCFLPCPPPVLAPLQGECGHPSSWEGWWAPRLFPCPSPALSPQWLMGTENSGFCSLSLAFLLLHLRNTCVCFHKQLLPLWVFFCTPPFFTFRFFV